MDWPIKNVSIVNLYLDQHNIRTPISEKDQNALIRDMFANEDAFSIVKSYVQNGIFPDEFPIVVKEDQKMIIIEGNRRVAALKALNVPSIVPAWEKKINSLNNPKITSIKVVFAPDRDAATRHIANKHTIDLRRPWKPLRQAYFYKSQIDNGKTIEDLISEFPDHNVTRFYKMLEMHHLAKSMNINESLISKVHNDRTFPITNLERFYNDKEVSKFLGIEFDEMGNVHGTIPRKEFEKGYTQLIEDIAIGKIDSREYNKSSERKEYIKSVPKENKPNLRKRGSFSRSDFKEITPPPKKAPKKSVRSKRIPKGLYFPSDLPFKLSSTSLRLMYNELRDIDVEKFPNATHDLLRSFLECSLVFFLKHTNEFKLIQKGNRHNPKLTEMLNFISSNNCTSIDDDNLKQVIKQVRSSWTDTYSLERMNMINHNENWTSSEKDVRSAWGKIEGLFKILLNPEN